MDVVQHNKTNNLWHLADTNKEDVGDITVYELKTLYPEHLLAPILFTYYCLFSVCYKSWMQHKNMCRTVCTVIL